MALLLFLLFLGSSRVIIFKNHCQLRWSRLPLFTRFFLLHSQETVFLVKEMSYFQTRIAPYKPTAHRNHINLGTILLRITYPTIWTLFHEHALKYAEVMGVCSVKCYLQREQKLQRWIETLLSPRSLKGTIVNYIYYYSPWRGDSFGGSPISVDCSMRKLYSVIQKWKIASCENIYASKAMLVFLCISVVIQ